LRPSALTRDGDDLRRDAEVDLAILGGEVPVDTLDGYVALKIHLKLERPHLRCAARYLKLRHPDQRGDLCVKFGALPQQLDEHETVVRLSD
jgi:DnaJ-class molecular chaperone